MAMEMIEQNKKYFKKRINEIIDDYLFDKGESYCQVQFWFEKSNGEHQEKVLVIGKPSNEALWTKTDETVFDARYKYSGEEFEISIVTAKCSVCGKFAEQVNTFMPRMSYEYCPHCGKKMVR